MSKHTPGPWKWEFALTGYYHLSANERHVLTIKDGFIPIDGDDSLIAAAPELLEALKALLAYADGYSNAMREIGRGADELGEGAASSSVAGMARAAIAKAEGR